MYWVVIVLAADKEDLKIKWWDSSLIWKTN